MQKKIETILGEALISKGMLSQDEWNAVVEEAIAVGVCAALEPRDYIVSTHRGHGHCIARGAEIKRMVAELLGKKTGYCGGRGGSMHISDIEGGNMGANGIVGAGIPLAVGAALWTWLRRRKL